MCAYGRITKIQKKCISNVLVRVDVHVGGLSTHWGRSQHFYGKHLFFPTILGYAYCSRFMHSIRTGTVLHSNVNDMAGVERMRVNLGGTLWHFH